MQFLEKLWKMQENTEICKLVTTNKKINYLVSGQIITQQNGF